jgi:putative phosphoesterase
VRLLRGADLILHGGDFVAAAVLEELRALGPPVEAVQGNMDERGHVGWFLKKSGWVTGLLPLTRQRSGRHPELKETLPLQRVIEVDGVPIGMVHVAGPRAGREARLAARFPDCEAVVYGHTHVPQVERFQHLWILNPGSPTERRSAPVHSMLVVTVRGPRLLPELVTLA